MQANTFNIDATLLRDILDALPVGVWIAAPDGSLVCNNPAGRAIWQGERRVGLDGYGEYKAWHCGSGQPVVAENWAMARALKDDETVLDEILDIQCFDGSRKTILHAGFPVHNPAGELRCGVVLNQDISLLRDKIAHLEDAHRQIEAFAIESISIQEVERKHLSRELHDEIGQNLTALKIALGGAQRACAGQAAEQALNLALEITDGLLETVRDLARRLRPSQLDDLGLVATLRWHLDKTPAPGLNTHFEENLGCDRLSPDIELCCFRIVQEALSNVLRHADASQVLIRLRREPDGLHLSLVDDGKGFEPEAVWLSLPEQQSLGLLGMRERIAALQGHFQVQSNPGHGTALQIHLPL